MQVFRRYFAPEIDLLRSQLTQITTERDWLREQYDGMVKASAAERRRNLKREDALTNQIIELGGGRRLPERFEAEVPEAKEPEFEDQEELVFKQRALEYLGQIHEGPITAVMVEKTIAQMKQDPQTWLTD